MNFDYYYGDESNQFAFYRIPRQLITGEDFKKLSTDAKLLYGLYWTVWDCPPKTAGLTIWGVCSSTILWMKYKRT